MASPNSIFGSSSSEQRWVNQINETLNPEKDNVINIDVCIFQLPKTQTATNPEAYRPLQLGLGPYHHLRPDFYKMQNYKLAAAKRVLRVSPIANSKELLVQKVKESELVIRGFYDQYIDLHGDTLALILAVDGLFLFDHLKNIYSYKNPKSGLIGEAERKLARDIMMLENQIPVFLLLKLIGKFLLQYSGDDSLLDEIELLSESEIVDKIETSVFNFLRAHCPLELSHQAQFQHNTNNVHLLERMYTLIVNNREMRRIITPDLIDDGKKIDSAAEKSEDDDVSPFRLFLNLPWKDILGSFNNSDKGQSTPSVEEIVVPSATQLSSIAKINFSKTKGGIRDIKFEEEKLTIYLPVIKLNIDSEVILRNLMAYEASGGISNSLELAGYVDLMCGIVDTAEDVKLLRKKGIIDEGGLSDEEIAKLFNGISKSSSGGKLKEMIEKVNEEVESTATVKSFRSLQKYAYTSLKVFRVMAIVGFVLLLALQSICQIYRCSNRFFGYQNTPSLSSADS